MDAGFDLNTNFSAAKSRSNIWVMLSSVHLEKYMDNLMKNGVDFHAFVNMTRDDMRHVGITNHQDQECLLAITKPLKMMYKELSGRPTNVKKVLESILDSIQTVGGTLVCVKQSLQQFPIQHSLIDPETAAIQGFDYVLDLIDSRADLIERDLTAFSKLYNGSHKNRNFEVWPKEEGTSKLLKLDGHCSSTDLAKYLNDMELNDEDPLIDDSDISAEPQFGDPIRKTSLKLSVSFELVLEKTTATAPSALARKEHKESIIGLPGPSLTPGETIDDGQMETLKNILSIFTDKLFQSLV